MLNNYKELKVWQNPILLSVDLGYIETGKLEMLREGIGEVDLPEAEKHLLKR